MSYIQVTHCARCNRTALFPVGEPYAFAPSALCDDDEIPISSSLAVSLETPSSLVLERSEVVLPDIQIVSSGSLSSSSLLLEQARNNSELDEAFYVDEDELSDELEEFHFQEEDDSDYYDAGDERQEWYEENFRWK